MKMLLSYTMRLLLMLPISVGSLAQTEEMADVDLDEVTVNITEDARSFNRSGRGELRSVVQTYMLENGDITQRELDTLRAERQTVREELRALRESGDKEALAARISELREKRVKAREKLREYVENNEELSAAIEEQREQLQDKRRDGDGRRGDD